MRKFQEKWAKLAWADKVVYVTDAVIALAVVIFGAVLLLGTGNRTYDLRLLSVAVYMLLPAYRNWTKNPVLAIFCLFAAGLFCAAILVPRIL